MPPKAKRIEYDPARQAMQPDTSEARMWGNLENRLTAGRERLFKTMAVQTEINSTRQGMEAGTQGMDKPPELKEGTSLASAAFNKAATSAYQAELRTDLRQSIGDLELNNPENPDSFNAGVDGIVDGILKTASPQLQPMIKETAATLSYGANYRLNSAVVRRAKDEQKASLLQDLEGQNADILNAANMGDSAGLAALYPQYVAEINNAAMAERDGGLAIISETEAAKQIIALDKKIDEQIIVGQFDRVLADEGLDAGLQFANDLKSLDLSELGYEPGDLSPDELEAIERRITVKLNRQQTIENRQQTQAKAAATAQAKALTAQVDNQIEKYEWGFEQGEEWEATFAALNALPVGTPGAKEAMDKMLVVDPLYRNGFHEMPPGQQDLNIDAQRQGLDEVDEKTGKRLNYTDLGRDMLEKMEAVAAQDRRGWENDPAAYGVKKGIFDPVVMDLTNPEGFMASFEAAAVNGQKLSAFLGRPVSGFTEAQTNELSRAYAAVDTSNKLAVIQTLAQTHTDPDILAAAGEAIDKTNPGLAFRVGVASDDTPDLANTRLLVDGQVLRQKFNASEMPTATSFIAELETKVGLQAYNGPGSSARKAMENEIMNAYAAIRRDQGGSNDNMIDGGVLDQAIKVVTGGMVEIDGVQYPTPERGVTQTDVNNWVGYGIGPEQFKTGGLSTMLGGRPVNQPLRHSAGVFGAQEIIDWSDGVTTSGGAKVQPGGEVTSFRGAVVNEEFLNDGRATLVATYDPKTGQEYNLDNPEEFEAWRDFVETTQTDGMVWPSYDSVEEAVEAEKLIHKDMEPEDLIGAEELYNIYRDQGRLVPAGGPGQYMVVLENGDFIPTRTGDPMIIPYKDTAPDAYYSTKNYISERMERDSMR